MNEFVNETDEHLKQRGRPPEGVWESGHYAKQDLQAGGPRWASATEGDTEPGMEVWAYTPAIWTCSSMSPSSQNFFFFFCIYLCNYAVHVSRVIFKLVKNGCREGTNPPEQIQSERTRRCKPSQPASQNRGPECLLLTRPKLSEKVLLLKLMFALILHTKPRHLAPAFEGNTVPQFTHRVPALCSEATH